MTGTRKIAFSKNFSIAEANEKVKMHGLSLTNLIFATINLSFAEMVKQQN